MIKCIGVLLQLVTLLHCSISFSASIITNPYRTDGFGAQFQTIIYSIIFAELHGQAYVYTPIQAMEHNYNEDPSFLERMESLMNLKDYYPINTDLKLQKNNAQRFIKFFESHIPQCSDSQALQRIKTLFRLNKDVENVFQNSRYNIAVHIRRKNLHDSRIEGTDTPDSIYIRTIDRLRIEHRDKNPLFHIFSQGDVQTFREIYSGNDIVLHINSSLEESFTAMVLADILVMSTSSLSYTAGLLSDGIIYYVPFWTPPLPGWKVIN